MVNDIAIQNNQAMRDGLGRAIYSPSFLLLFSTVRIIVSCHSPSAASLEKYHYLLASLPNCFTWIIWQCYFANSIASVLVFRRQWEAFVWWQKWLFYIVGFLLLPVAFAVAIGLLQCSIGPSPSLLLQLAILTPATLWVIPVALSATLTIFRMNDDVTVLQTQERAGIHIVHLLLYFAFLRTSALDNLAGAGNTMYAMFSMTFVGFMVQLLWHMLLDMYFRRLTTTLDTYFRRLTTTLDTYFRRHTAHMRVYFRILTMEPTKRIPQQEEQERGRSELEICALRRPIPMQGKDTLLTVPDKAPLHTDESLNKAELVAVGHRPVPREMHYP